MNANRLGKVLDQLLRENAADADLLERFVRQQDEGAFEALVRRHGPMVWSVCKRVLRNAHDAEDAFQAVFLLLIRKAGSIGKPQLLANWLYGVSYRTALRAKEAARKRKEKEGQAEPRPRTTASELREVIDQELARLPDKYRLLIVLCDLEERTRVEVARQLGLPEGTVASRLSRGRLLLAKRLKRYGLPSGAVAVLASEASAVPHD